MENKKLTKCNKRKADLEEEEEQSELLSTTCSIQLKTRRLDANTPQEMNSNTCESVNTDHHHHHHHHVLVSSSCCSSTNTHELAIKENLKKSADLEEEEENKVNVQELMATSAGDSVDFSDRRESTPLREIQAEVGELESTAMPLRRSNHPRRRSTAAKAPSENEIEEFFSVAEKNLQKQFIDKYNFDIVKDEPLEGRFEWVQIQLKP